MNKKGYTLLEMMIVVAIISILSTVGMNSLKGRAEKRALLSMSTKIPMFLENLRDKSYDTGKRYSLKFRLDENKIYVLEYKMEELKDSISELNLSKYLLYEDNTEKKQFERDTTPKGNYSNGFSVIIFDQKRERVLKRISISTGTDGVDYAMVNSYKPKTSLTLSNYKESNKWEKE